MARIKRFEAEPIRFGTSGQHFDQSVKTYQMSEEERQERMNVNPVRYVEFKEKGLSDSKIAKEMGISIANLNNKKSHWGFVNKSVNEMKAIVKRKTNQHQRKQSAAPNMSDDIHQQSEEKKTEKQQVSQESTQEADDQTEEIRSLRQELQGVKSFNANLERQLEEANEKAKRLASVQREFETLESKYQQLTEDYQQAQEELMNAQTKQSITIVQQQLENAKRAFDQEVAEHKQTKEKLDSAVINNETLARNWKEEQKRHEQLATYTQLVMPS
ncbi:hypothetical protein [Halobacillus salinus]|uniref:hypothetical protein n=1 Tax=Halobacillus salinus TaxID=192814 RepID=UPI0009A6C819|nr:hypothetical protein [Halobacillus salinus]